MVSKKLDSRFQGLYDGDYLFTSNKAYKVFVRHFKYTDDGDKEFITGMALKSMSEDTNIDLTIENQDQFKTMNEVSGESLVLMHIISDEINNIKRSLRNCF